MIIEAVSLAIDRDNNVRYNPPPLKERKVVNMNEKNSFLYEDAVQTALSGLSAIQDTLETIIMGMKKEQLEVQVISCMECISLSLHGLQTRVNELLPQTENQPEVKTDERQY